MAEAIILKNSKRQAVVQFNGPGSVYANLHSLLHANVGGYTEQTFTNSNAIATITFINATTSGSGNVIRTVDGVATVAFIPTSGNNITYSFTAGQSDASFSQNYGFVLNPTTQLGSNANVRVDFGTSTGTVIIGMSKGAGFNDLDLQNMQSHIRGNFT